MIIRNNKDNKLFQPGYALENGKFVYSQVFIADIIKPREIIEKENDDMLNNRPIKHYDYIDSFGTNNFFSKVVEENEMDVMLKKTAPSRVHRLNATLGASTAAAVVIVVLTALAVVKLPLLNWALPLGIVLGGTFTLTALSSASKIKEVKNIRSAITKRETTKYEAAKDVTVTDSVVKELTSKEKYIQLRNDAEKEVVLIALEKARLNDAELTDIYQKLDKKFVEEVSKPKTKELERK